MRAHLILVAAATLLAAPMPALAGDSSGTAPTAYVREERALGAHSRLIYESVAIEGARLTDAIRATADLSALAGTHASGASAAVAVQTVQYKTIGRRMTAVNNLGWVVIQYTVWQEFGYDGTKITYAPPPSYDYQANWGWRLASHSETARWITKPTHRTSRGEFLFEQEIWSPYGSIGLGKLSGWVAVFFRGTGAWTGANS